MNKQALEQVCGCCYKLQDQAHKGSLVIVVLGFGVEV